MTSPPPIERGYRGEPKDSVYQLEIKAIELAANQISNMWENNEYLPREAIIFSDSQSAVKALDGHLVMTDEVVRAKAAHNKLGQKGKICLLYTSPSPRDGLLARMPSSA